MASEEVNMLLSEFTVTKFRNVLDSEPVVAERDVTCLVGKNESGKTAILEALYRLNPVYPALFDVQDDYPRWRAAPDRRKGLIDDVEVISATFDLQDKDIEAVDALVGPGVLVARKFTAFRTYGEPSVLKGRFFDRDGGINEAKAVENLIEQMGTPALPTPPEGIANLGLLAQTAGTEAAALTAEAATSVADAAANAEQSGQPVPVQPNDSDQVLALNALVAAANELAPTGNVADVIETFLIARVPRFFFFTDYHFLPGRIDLAELAQDSTEEAGASPTQTARSLLRLAGTTPQELMGEDYERRKGELETVGNDLTRQVLDYWRQNPDLRVTFDVDPVVLTDGNGNLTVLHKILEVRVEDRRHEFTNNFSKRSSGFRWFFSFLAAFTEFEEADDDVVVLLDEPALTLHGRAQADFLRFVNDRLAPVAQVLYTTHSPFLVETDRIDRVRVVEDTGPDVGVKVTSESLKVSDDTLFPLQAALGYDIAQNLFVGDTNLLVEGPSDFVYLDAISRRLSDESRVSLDPRWRILTAGGSGNIPAFVTLLGQKVNVTVLVDSGTEGTGRLQAAIAAGRLSASRLVSVSEITGKKNGDIEDLFEVADYLSLFNAAFDLDIKESNLPPGDRIVKRIEQATGERFDHWKPARFLLSNPTEPSTFLSPTTLDTFERLNVRINTTINA